MAMHCTALLQLSAEIKDRSGTPETDQTTSVFKSACSFKYCMF